VAATRYPGYAVFARACTEGLAVVYPFTGRSLEDPHGWKFGSGYPPSYAGFGRMRALLAVHDSLRVQPRRVLELAAGGGGLAASLASHDCAVTANDLLADQLATTLREYETGGRVAVAGGNLFELNPETLGRFDLVIACEVIEHVAHPEDLLRQLRRFLAPGGRILLTTPNGAHFRNRLPTLRQAGDVSELERRQFKPDADGHLFLLTPAELCELAEAANLEVDELNLWGTPLLSGHAGCRIAAGPWATRPAFHAEQLAQHLPLALRQRLCAAMSAVLSAK
jgi:2-polyprenyl-3-methyl-5-hydroxy-6-metoxy-1,4-benzoquinol methylase